MHKFVYMYVYNEIKFYTIQNWHSCGKVCVYTCVLLYEKLDQKFLFH